MTRRNSLAKIAIAALLALGLASHQAGAQAPAQQQPSTNAAGTATGQVQGMHFPDPNFPTISSPPGLKLSWRYTQDLDVPSVTFLNPLPKVAGEYYMGYNSEGSFFEGEGNKIYVWNLKNNTLQVRYQNAREIPPDVVASLKNPHGETVHLLAQYRTPAKPAPAPPQQPAKSPQRGAGLFVDPGAAESAVAGLQNQAGATPPGSHAAGQIAGTGATVQGGVLTFARSDNSKATYKVVRPKMAQGNPQTTGFAGPWVAMEENGKGIMFTVHPDGSVAGLEMPALAIQMLMQGGQR